MESMESIFRLTFAISDGKSFIILDKKKFTDEVLPRFFNEAKFTSFTRKLNRWRFKRVTKGIESGSYHHHVSFTFYFNFYTC